VHTGDVITRIGDEQVASYEDLLAVLRRYATGDTVSVMATRGRTDLELSVILGDLGEVLGKSHSGEAYLGVGFAPEDPYPEGEFQPVSFDITTTMELDGRP
jgi:PDZ domain-containing secreted protein